MRLCGFAPALHPHVCTGPDLVDDLLERPIAHLMARASIRLPRDTTIKGTIMSTADEALSTILTLDGAIAVAVVEFSSGLTLAQRQNSAFDLELAAAANTEVVKAKLNAIERLGLNEKIEDILITLTHQYHLIRLSAQPALQGTFTYLVLDRSKSNLALARRALATFDEQFTL